mgnify:CR=1 FL=1
MKHPSQEVSIGLVGKYVEYEDSYKSLKEALLHGGLAHNAKVNITWIEAEIWVEKDGQKAIVIGRNGARLKELGAAARRSLEQMLGRPVYLRTYVKTRAAWTQDPATLARLETGNG